MKTCIFILVQLFSLSFCQSFHAELQHSNSKDCIDGPSTWYTGSNSYTKTGTPCQRWDTFYPHNPRFIPQDGGHHNYCRNPDNDINGLWCYTTNPSKRWEYCDVAKCYDDSLVLWADLKNSTANILAIEADPEVIGSRTSQIGNFNVSVLVDSEQVGSHFTDVTGSYVEQTIFYVDSGLNNIVVNHLERKMTSIHLSGLAANIKAIAYDWIRHNLYWTDDVMKWVMTSDRTMTYYTPVYRTNPDPPCALALHAANRKLYFSTYKPMASKVIMTEMDGGNPEILFQFPRVFEVTSLSIDCTDERLYIADYWGHGATVISSDLNGLNMKRHYFRRGSRFIGISAYMNHIYMADAQGRFTYDGEYVHSIWVKSKTTRKTMRFNFDGEPRGMKVLSRNEERTMDAESPFGSCAHIPPCDHICLPRINATRECACSVGYHKQGDTGCVAMEREDNFLLVFDENQRKLFRFSLDDESNVEYGILPLDVAISATSTMSDPTRGSILMSDRGRNAIYKYSSAGNFESTLAETFNPGCYAVDAMTGNVFFSDVTNQAIYVTNNNGDHVRQITTSRTQSDIKSMVVDVGSKKLYWTDTNSRNAIGEVWRMNFDGSMKERVLGALNWPHSITIDYERNSIFVSDLTVVHEISRESLTNITNQEEVTMISHDLDDTSVRKSYRKESHVKDIAIHRDMIYFIQSHRVRRLNLISDVIEDYGPRDFYELSSISLYNSDYLRQYTGSFSNPCITRFPACMSICLPLSDTTSSCV